MSNKIPIGYLNNQYIKEYNNSCYNCYDVENIWKPIKKIPTYFFVAWLPLFSIFYKISKRTASFGTYTYLVLVP
jgi:hypothetical protein